MDGWEICRLGSNIIQARSLTNNALIVTVNTPFPINGNLFIDRINKYLVCALRGPRVYAIDLFRWTSGLPGATQMLTLPYPSTAQATDDIAFLPQLRQAMVHVDIVPKVQTELVALSLQSAGVTAHTYPSFTSLPRINKQIYVHPFRGLVNYPFYIPPPAALGGDVTIDMTPTTWDPPQDPQVKVDTLSAPPIEAVDSLPPAPTFTVSQQSPQPGDAAGITGFDIIGLEPGSTVLADVTSAPGIEPLVGTADADGYSDDITIPLDAAQTVCFTAVDPAGNAAPPVCINARPVSVPGSEVPRAFAFALAGANPVHRAARFALALPSAGHVRLGVYDVAGRLVSAVVDGQLPAGQHELAWDLSRTARTVEPGVYFARLHSPAGDASVRVVVVR
jgi:hypothetical protein